MSEQPTQDEVARREALAKSSTNSGSATGQAQAHASGKEDELLEGLKKRPAPEGAPKQGDFGEINYEKPQGLQAEEANYTPGGTIPANMVSSPAGFVPISAVSDPEEAMERTLGRSGDTRDNRLLTEEDLDALDGPSVRAIGVQRGYPMADLSGSAATRRAFLREQEKDDSFKPEKKTLMQKVTGKN